MEHVFAQIVLIAGSSVAVLGLSAKVKRLCRKALCRCV